MGGGGVSLGPRERLGRVASPGPWPSCTRWEAWEGYCQPLSPWVPVRLQVDLEHAFGSLHIDVVVCACTHAPTQVGRDSVSCPPCPKVKVKPTHPPAEPLTHRLAWTTCPARPSACPSLAWRRRRRRCGTRRRRQRSKGGARVPREKYLRGQQRDVIGAVGRI